MIPGPLPYQGNIEQLPLNEVDVVGSKSVQRPIDWQGFQEYLSKTCRKNTAKNRMFHAKKYASVLINPASTALTDTLLQLSPDKRINAMKSLVALSKYLGCYDKWLQIRHRYNLKRSTGNESLQSFERLLDSDTGQDYNAMLQAICQMIQKLPAQMAQVIIFACLAGLRSGEVFESVKLLKSGTATSYYNPERQRLEHFRFPEIFFRRTKKAYISFVTPDILEAVSGSSNSEIPPTYEAIRLTCRRRGINCDIRFCRKLFATHLRQSGVAIEIIDAMQGRTPSSVFAKHYYRLSMDYRDNVLAALKTLRQKIL